MDRSSSSQLKVYVFSTFFYPKLVRTGYSSLKRWTRRVDIFSYDILLVPVHLDIHWTLAVINFKEKTIKYYDSLGHSNDQCLNLLRQYLHLECKDKKGEDFCINMQLINMKDIPQQMNSSDCGVFACKFAEYASRHAKINFSQVSELTENYNSVFIAHIF
ncbi:unnamed protein product [Soboliphyme baturini]|uniref:ULP_PROTEASE domain-containing protein n=1 Tax=Soboliphyme baturini TaxID=241478 RepID=A0A183J444_9BILA|nr:unnamed protein product [Soboliphyme baturini]